MPPNHGHRRLPVDMAAGICADSCCRQQIGGRRHWLALPFNACRLTMLFTGMQKCLKLHHCCLVQVINTIGDSICHIHVQLGGHMPIQHLGKTTPTYPISISTPVTRRCWKRSLLTTTSDFPTDFQFSACRRVRGCMLRQPDVNRNEHHSLFSSIFYIIC
uniref:Uncharacterized protein n=1 Tax=Leersia perrieri TaxID=77586 RepID=A0A0D9WT69_9ORYZ